MRRSRALPEACRGEHPGVRIGTTTPRGGRLVASTAPAPFRVLTLWRRRSCRAGEKRARRRTEEGRGRELLDRRKAASCAEDLDGVDVGRRESR